MLRCQQALVQTPAQEIALRRASVGSCHAGTLSDFDDCVDFYRCPKRRVRARHSAAGVAADVTKNFNHQVRTSVDDASLTGEIGGAGNKSTQFDNRLNTGQIVFSAPTS